jgi:GNAT superfamily N-acetyltransferase
MRNRIRRARMEDAEALPAIERSAGTLFRALPDLAWIADDSVMPAEEHRPAIAAGPAGVAETAAGLAGFLSARLMPSSLYLAELSVRRDCQEQGLGRGLIGAAAEHARSLGVPALTLTTFRDVPWNGPFYARLGFTVMEEDALEPWLAAIRAEETARGLTGRCAMRLPLDPFDRSLEP